MQTKKSAINIAWGFLLFFVLFILVILFAHTYFSAQKSKQIAVCRNKLFDALNKISLYHSDERFFAGVFNTAFLCADNSAKPLLECKLMALRLKRQFNNGLTLVFFNKNGSIINELSDKTGYGYVLKAMYEVMSEVFAHLKNGETDFLTGLDVLKKRIKLLRGYFGQFLPEKLVAKPMLDMRRSAALRVSKEPGKGLLWYNIYNNFAVIAFVNSSLLGQSIGPAMLVKAFNKSKKNNGIQIGYYTTKDMKIHGVKPLNSSLITEIINYAGSACEFAETKNYLRAFKYLSPELIAFSQINKSSVIDINQALTALTANVFKWLFLLCFAACCVNLRYELFCFSFRQKITALFLLGSLLPMSVVFILGFGYFEQKSKQLINDVYQNAANIIKEADSRYLTAKEAISKRINTELFCLNKKYGAKPWHKSDISLMQRLIEEYKPDFIGFIKNSGEALITSHIGAQSDSIKNYYFNVLRFANNNRLDYKIKPSSLLQELTDEAYLYNATIEGFNKISKKAFGTAEYQVYAGLTGDKHSFSCWGILVVGWRSHKLWRAFLAQSLSKINDAISPMCLAAAEEQSERVVPKKFENAVGLKNMAYSSFAKKIVKNDELFIDNMPYIAVSMCSSSMPTASLTAVYPKSLVNKQLRGLLYTIIFVLSLGFFIMLFIAHFFANRLIVPVKELNRGLSALARGDYTFQSNYTTDGEFKRLFNSFNETIKNLNMLSLGTEAQQSLLPSGSFNCKNIEIYARSIFMNKMGGDYFDYYTTKNNLIGVFFGDVAGHGIPAAVLTAAAKAAFAAGPILGLGDSFMPSTALGSINEALMAIQEKKHRRMMTALSLVISAETGEYRLAMAGQTYPLIISADNMFYAEAVGKPLGVSKNAKWAEKSGVLKNGDIMVLYSDGIIEAQNQRGEIFGFRRFEELIASSFSRDLKSFYKSIISGYNKYISVQEDDITLMLIKYEKKGANV